MPMTGKTRVRLKNDALQAVPELMALSKPLTTANPAVSPSMSKRFSIANSLRRFRYRTTVDCHQSSSWPGWTIALLNKWSRWSERNRERAFLRDVADSQQLLNELGLTREQALNEANRPFWE